MGHHHLSFSGWIWPTKVVWALCFLILCAVCLTFFFKPENRSDRNTGNTDLSDVSTAGPNLKISIEEFGGGSHVIDMQLLADGIVSDPFILNSVSFVFPETLSNDVELSQLGSIHLESEFTRPLRHDADHSGLRDTDSSIHMVANYRSECALHVRDIGPGEDARYAVAVLQGNGDGQSQIMALSFNELDQAPAKMRQALSFAIELMQEQYESLGVETAGHQSD